MPRLVPRSRLFEELDRGAGSRLTLVVGAPGAGKTTLLADWLAARTDVPSAWLGCDAGDSDPVRFVSALVHGLRYGFGEERIGEDTLALLGFEGEVSVDAFGALADDLEGLDGARTLAIDDLHLASGESADVFGQLLDARPLSLQIVVATRFDPSLRLQRMRAREELVELRDEDLAFSAEETKGFLSAFGLDLPERDIQSVHHRTEGWSTGLQMAALAIQKSPDPVGAIRHGVHSNSVGGFFVEEVLSQQPPAVVDFMLASSVLDDLSVDACSAVIGEGAAAMLDHLANAHLFVTVSDVQAGSYRYHQLIKEVLQAELHRRDPKREAELHDSYAQHLLAEGHAGAAARHLLAAGESTTAFELLSDRVVRDVLTNPTVGSALDLDELRPELFVGVPEVLAPLAAELLWRGAFERGARAVALARQTQVDPARDPALAVRFALMNTLYCTFVGELDEALEHRDRARSFETTVTGVDDWIVSLDALAMYCNAYAGGLDDARRLAEALVAGGASVPLTDLLCPGVISQVALMEGDFDEAAALAEATVEAATRLRFEQHYFAFHALRTVGQLALERRDLPAASDSVETALAIVNGARPVFYFLAQVDRARIWAAGGDREEALDSLPAARAALKSPHSMLLAEADELEARLRLGLGDVGGALTVAERLPAPRRAVMGAIIALAGGDAVAAERALGGAPVAGSTLRSDVELQLLRAGVALVDSRQDAPQLATSALLTAQRHGFRQTVLDTAPQLLDHLVSQPDAYPEVGDLRPLVTAYLDGQSVIGSRTRETLVEPLTEAELRVLAKLAERRSYAEIASELYLSIHTVKTHVRHVFMKLGVNSRSSAVSRATVLRLFD